MPTTASVNRVPATSFARFRFICRSDAGHPHAAIAAAFQGM